MTALPAPELRPWISHYWLSLHNLAEAYAVLPDGAVDLVIKISPYEATAWLYGCTTQPVDVALSRGCHYLGVRFQPGQSRHFIDVTAAELTNHAVPAAGLLRVLMDMDTWACRPCDWFTQLNQFFSQYLSLYAPKMSRIDDVIRLIRQRQGIVGQAEMADIFTRSPRQLERVFLETVGISSKLFTLIARFHHASRLIKQYPNTPFAGLAAMAGYADQAHMARDFRRLAGVTPTQFRQHVVIVQDLADATTDTDLVTHITH
ncbi:helix-turn-helix domain-containing protein [Chitinivorax sp. B]|uniref:AraC family transcriptional regulator n=1 Tax=Chitinivorax sp. B TaxID=2502235 RepID=UPI001485A0E0|nr:helix-turn-helix domain-containing protein [Chitinivorax sp. B]